MKRIITLLLVLCIFVSIAPMAFADYATDEGYILSGDVEPCNDETAWYFKMIDGAPYKRLWSYTQQKWLTDWIPA